jgi:hypothetical protein
MANEPRATDSTAAPKKRTRKPTTETETSTKVTKTAKNGSKPIVINEVAPAANLEEQIRIRAYELYLERSCQGGSPEQDWFQAAAEIYGESVA